MPSTEAEACGSLFNMLTFLSHSPFMRTSLKMIESRFSNADTGLNTNESQKGLLQGLIKQREKT